MASEYRADQIGSFLRPAGLLEAREAYKSGSITLEQLRALEDTAILDVLENQRRVGVGILSDGELRRDAWMSGLADAVDGFVDDHRIRHWNLPGGGTLDEPSRGKVAGAKLRQVRRITGHESSFLARRASGPFKVTMPSPVYVAGSSYKEGITEAAYASRGELLEDLVAIVKGEMQALVDEGVGYIQLDEGFASYVGLGARGDSGPTAAELATNLETDIAAENACYDSLPRDRVTLGTHVCRGNSKSRWTGAIPYDHIAEQVFSSLHVDRFLLEYDTERAGGFEPLRFVSKGKTAVLGLVSTKHGVLESQDDLLRRIDEASKFLPIDQLALSPQCGFASVSEGNLLTEEEQWRKLDLVVETARRVWD